MRGAEGAGGLASRQILQRHSASYLVLRNRSVNSRVDHRYPLVIRIEVDSGI